MPDTMTEFLNVTRAKVEADPEARFAIALDHLTYGGDSHRLGVDLVRNYARRTDPAVLDGRTAADVAQLLRGLNILTRRSKVLGGHYGELATSVRDAGGSLFNWQNDQPARDVVVRIAASDPWLTKAIAERNPEVPLHAAA